MHAIINHELLLNKLSSAGFGPGTLKWFRKDRTQCVHVEDLKSDVHDISKGVPQGSILFSIYINDLGKDIKKKTFMLMILLFIHLLHL